MANKLLRTLTLGGTPMDVHEAPLGIIVLEKQDFTLSANVKTTLHTFTLPKPGHYLITNVCYLEANAYTGTAYALLQSDTLYQGTVTYQQYGTTATLIRPYIVSEAQGTATITNYITSGVARRCSSYLRVIRLEDLDA